MQYTYALKREKGIFSKGFISSRYMQSCSEHHGTSRIVSWKYYLYVGRGLIGIMHQRKHHSREFCDDCPVNSTVRRHAPAANPAFDSMNDNTWLYGAVVADDYQESDGILRMEWSCCYILFAAIFQVVFYAHKRRM